MPNTDIATLKQALEAAGYTEVLVYNRDNGERGMIVAPGNLMDAPNGNFAAISMLDAAGLIADVSLYTSQDHPLLMIRDIHDAKERAAEIEKKQAAADKAKETELQKQCKDNAPPIAKKAGSSRETATKPANDSKDEGAKV